METMLDNSTRRSICSQWGPATGNAATVATATFYVVKDNKAEKIP
jgi:hypothetical protein